jgi:hypothetical protein
MISAVLLLAACASQPTTPPSDRGRSRFVLDPRDRAQELKLIDAVHGLIDVIYELNSAARRVTGIDVNDPFGDAPLVAASSSAYDYLGSIQSAEGRAMAQIDEIGRQVAALQFAPRKAVALAAIPALRSAVLADIDTRSTNARDWADFYRWLLYERDNLADSDGNPSTIAFQAAESVQRLRSPTDVSDDFRESFVAAIEGVLDPLRIQR